MAPTPTKITGSMAIELLRQARDRRGADYVYVNDKGQRAGSITSQGVGQLATADCSYVHTGPDGAMTPGCIAGEVLHAAGVPLVELLSWEGCAVGVFAQEMGFANEEGEFVLTVAQGKQDIGETWGEAVAAAEAAYAAWQEGRAARQEGREAVLA